MGIPSSPDEVENHRSPPTPPPLPRLSAHNKNSKASPFVLKLRSAPPGYFYQPANLGPHIDPIAAPSGPYFFYGTLMDPSMLAEILNLEVKPVLRPASLVGYFCKLWGQYPALVDGATGTVVEGAVYDVQTTQDGEKLAYYETKNYETASCSIRYMDGKEPATAQGHTFKYVGNPNDLSEGGFDLKIWLRRMGRGLVVDELEARKIGSENNEECGMSDTNARKGDDEAEETTRTIS